MECSKAQDLLSEYIDNMLDEDINREIEEHLSVCSRCKQEFELLDDIIKNCHKFGEENLPRDFNRELHDKLLAESHNIKGKGSAVPWIRRYSSVAAALLILVVSFSLIAGTGLLNRGLRKDADSATKNDLVADSAARSPASRESAPALDQKVAMDNGAGQQSVIKPSAAQFNTMDKTIGTTGVGMLQNTLVIKITEDEYKKYYQGIINSIEGLRGDLLKNSIDQFTMPNEELDPFLRKLNDEYNINNVVLETTDLLEDYNNLQSEIAALESKQKEVLADGNSADLNEQLAKKRVQLEKLSDRTNYIYVVINRI